MYTIDYDPQPDHLSVRITGPESFEAAVGFWEGLARKAGDEGHRRILVVDEVSGRLTMLELHKVSEVVSSLFRGRRLAFVDPKDDTWEDNRFGETVVRNRSGGVRLFRAEGEAREWLLRSD